ncbi:uncharacterized protein LOC113275339 [Papaver somniferum]|uniref:uncharacterized protein LOC113275339 n=1 Tax=Papaver somniferum TaxID=3469 RepID=UPI000E6FB5C8|nr:uncharacterized protein LOC113275339 [Papaver somniferum]
MPHPILNPFIACINGGKKRAISGKKSCNLKIDQGEEEKEQQNVMERGSSSYLPEELMIESILTRLPARTLAVSCCVSKLWGDSLVLSYLRPTGGYIYVCHGFGFDSLSQVYKVVAVFASKASHKFLCMVVTLVTMSWRKITTTTFGMAPPPGSSPFPSRMLTRVSRTLCRQATFCGGDLFWRTKNKVVNNDDKIEMLLSFDLHNEKIRFIRLPAECTPITAPHERQDLVVDHLLEFKGYPCIARSERRSNSIYHCGHCCNYQTGFCCCCYKIHMYILKDKDKQVWTREETFDVQNMDQEGLLPPPLCRYFDTSDAMPPTRISTCSDQVFLYWFNGERLIFCNLQEKHLKVVECSRSYPSIFRSKMNEDLERCIGGDDDNIYCPSMDYQLHAKVENIISLNTFIPKDSKISEVDCVDELKHLVDNNLATGWLISGRNKHTYYVFF